MKPIIFSAPMVRAILDGRKTVTRRVVKLNITGRVDRAGRNWHLDDPNAALACRFQPGDRLWVRERMYRDDDRGLIYADGTLVNPTESDLLEHINDWASKIKAKKRSWSPIHMPRWASRITLEVVSVRVERLHDITEEDAKAEGVEPVTYPRTDRPLEVVSRHSLRPVPYTSGFANKWNDINPKTLWHTNPWVWRIEFKRNDGGVA